MTKSTRIIIIIFCLVKLTLHIIADFHSGFQGDELLHIDTGNHLAFGYMEFPPVIGVLAFIQNLFHTQSVFIHHLFPHIATILIVIYLGKTVFELGGGSIATAIALSCLLISPGFGGSQQSFQPVVFSQCFWLISFYQLVRFVKYEDRKYLWYLTIFISLAFLTKYDALFFFVGIAALLFFRRTRKALRAARYWQCMVVALLILLPNIVWQYANNFPALQMFARLYETQLDELTFSKVVFGLFLDVNPITAIMLIPTLIFIWGGQKTKHYYRPIASSILLSIAFLAYSKGKAYYFFPIVLTLLPFCGILFEHIILPKRKWLLIPLSVILLLGTVLIPFGLPIYSYAHYMDRIHKYFPKNVKNGKEVLPMQEYITKQKWETSMHELHSVYDSLPPNEKTSCLIWGKHYSQAGAVELMKSTFGLPNAFCYHGSFYSWAPLGRMPQTVIAICYNDTIDDFFYPFFEEVVPVRKLYSPYASSEGWVLQTIYICKKPKQDFNKMKDLFKSRIFE